MLFIKELNLKVADPNALTKLTVNTKNAYSDNFLKGFVFIVMPDGFEEADKKHKKIYKLGWIYDALTVLHPELGKQQKYEIISEKFQFWFTYRQFKTILDEYESNKSKYLFSRNLL